MTRHVRGEGEDGHCTNRYGKTSLVITLHTDAYGSATAENDSPPAPVEVEMAGQENW